MVSMKKGQCIVVDTCADFLTYWKNVCSRSLNEQVKLWQTVYMAKYPELLKKQLQSYEEEGVNWREIAEGRVFPKLPKHFSLVQKARRNILTVWKFLYNKASQRLGIEFDIILVIYVGIGCGAGWATKYHGQPACLLGLENIAEEKWHTKTKLQGLIAHEIGHLAHMAWRNEWEIFEKAEEDTLFHLYSEGFAQRCEHVILGKETWHMAQDKDWLSWCKQSKNWLAKEFLSRIRQHASTRDFFGSWFSIQGKKQTGYFLGHAFIRELEKIYTLREIALLNFDKVRELAMSYLLSAKGKPVK